ncbi:MAG TPA: hypothetical protein VHX64_14805 [Caulobacteraceae bacterium]|jgi:hypothetical protein|nr:hypothetical protein [Caulobacteraceae bacterium]
MKRIQYNVLKDGDRWAIERDGKRLHQYPTLPDAEAAAFDMARTDRDEGEHVDVIVEGKPDLWGKQTT